jgi:hypothetical protein
VVPHCLDRKDDFLARERGSADVAHHRHLAVLVVLDRDVVRHAPGAGRTGCEAAGRLGDTVLLVAMHAAFGILQPGIGASGDPEADRRRRGGAFGDGTGDTSAGDTGNLRGAARQDGGAAR